MRMSVCPYVYVTVTHRYIPVYLTVQCKYDIYCSGEYDTGINIYRIPRLYSVPRGILYPLPKIRVHLLVSSLEVLYSFLCTEQMCSPEKAEHIDI